MTELEKGIKSKFPMIFKIETLSLLWRQYLL